MRECSIEDTLFSECTTKMLYESVLSADFIFHLEDESTPRELAIDVAQRYARILISERS